MLEEPSRHQAAGETSGPFGLALDGLSDPGIWAPCSDGGLAGHPRRLGFSARRGHVQFQSGSSLHGRGLPGAGLALWPACHPLPSWPPQAPGFWAWTWKEKPLEHGGGKPGTAEPWVAVTGSESHGAESVEVAIGLWRSRIHIPGRGSSESLNATMAAGLVLGEWGPRVHRASS